MGGWAALKNYQHDGIRVKGDERILGNPKFVEKVLKQAGEELEQRTRLQATALDLGQLIKNVANHYQVSEEALKTPSKARTVSLARCVLCYLAVRKLFYSCAEVVRGLHISPSAVSKSVIKGAHLLSKRIRIQKEILGI